MTLHPSTFQYLKPTDEQLVTMGAVREAFASLAQSLDALLPDGADKNCVLRRLRECAMWANVTLTRHADGSPRT